MESESAKGLVALDVLATFAIFLSLYSYAVYPFILILLRPLLNKKVNRADIEPTVSMIIAVYNEEKKIKEKLDNTLELEYPPDKLEIIVASDASTDGTEAIVQRFQGVKLLRARERGGK